MLSLLFSFLCLITVRLAADVPTPVLTISPSVVTVGSPFTLSCEIANIQPPQDAYGVFFRRNNLYIMEYHFPSASSGNRQPVITRNRHNFTDISMRPLPSTATVYQMQITPHTVYSYNYSCQIDYKGYKESLYLTVKPVVGPTPIPTFSLNTGQPQMGISFLASCHLSQFNPSHSAHYFVEFHSKRDGLLATFDISPNRSLVSVAEHPNITVSHEFTHVFPNFEVILTQKTPLKQEFWCSLRQPDLGTVESAHWKEVIISFTTSKPDSTSRQGVCSITDNFEATGKTYSIHFYSNIGPLAENRLATYLIQPNHILEFDFKQVPNWTEITYGSLSTFPNFDIIVKNASFTGNWWCELQSVPYSYHSDRVALA